MSFAKWSRKLLLLTLFFYCICGAEIAQENTIDGEKKAEAKTLVKQASDLLLETFTITTIKEAIGILEKSAQLDPDNIQVWIKLSGNYWRYGDRLPREASEQKKERLRWFEKGEAAADKALAMNPQNADALFWKTSNMASSGDMKGWLSSLWMAPTLLSNMDKVEAMSPGWGYGAVDRFWTEVLCRVPLFLAKRYGHSVKEIIGDLEEEIKKEPCYLYNYVYIARLYWKAEGKDKALNSLENALTHNPLDLPEKKAENVEAQSEARKMWKEYSGKDFPNR